MGSQGVLKASIQVLTYVAVLFAASAAAQQQQQKCLQPGRLEQIRAQIKAAGPQAENIALKDELVNAARDISAAIRLVTVEKRGDEKAKADLANLESELTTRVCAIFNTQGWPARSALSPEGMNALVFVVSKALPFPMQIELYPAIADAFEKGEVAGGEVLAAYVDQLRIVIGRKQLYGTQAYIRDGFIVLAPVESPETVDDRRRKFGMEPLRDYERFLEISNQLPLIRSVGDAPRETASATTGAGTSPEGTVAPSELSPAEEEQAITVDTAFVNLDIVVGAGTAEQVALEKSDFRLSDNGKPAEIESFARADAPFDIVLLLDLSGSTADKVGLIKKTTRRFVEMKRPVDRIAVIAFHDRQTVVSELEADKQVLLERLKNIKGYGASYVWDAVRSGLDMLEKNSGKDRRKAIVLMSDGVDTSLSFTARLGSRTSFADLTDRIRRSTVSIFPIYLDTEGPDPYSKKVYAIARHALRHIADQSAGNLYTARKIEDLAGIYEQVLRDVGTVYTLGFSPDVAPGDPRWRTLRVEIPTRPGLKIKHRPGYFVR